MTGSLVCPQCGAHLEMDEALEHTLEEKISVQKRELWEKAKTEAAKKYLVELQEKEKALLTAREAALDFQRQKIRLEEEKKNLELTVARRVEEERKQIFIRATAQARDEELLKRRELEKQLSDFRTANEELRRKIEQGSQQTQGEVLELELERSLKTTFYEDSISEVPKGVRGADLIQTVRSRNTDCGSIIWEMKRSKVWNDQWIAKLKDDQRSVKAALAVIVTETLPKEVTHFAIVQGVWVTSFSAALGVASTLRALLIQVAAAHASYEDRQGKMDVLYTYVTGVEFRQRIEAIIDAFRTMHEELDQEKRAYERIWARREKQIEMVVKNTLGIHGDMQGLLGNALPELKVAQLGE